MRFRSGIFAEAREEMKREKLLDARPDVSIDVAVREALGWLERAQDYSSSEDGGVARHYGLLNGWSASLS